MKLSKILVALTLVLMVSCNKKENKEAMESLAGHWHVWDFVPNNESDDATLAKESITKLVKIGCDPIEYTFKKEGYVSHRTGMRYLKPTTDETGVNVTCAPAYDNEEGTFDYDNKTLTLNYDSGTVELNANIEEPYLTMMVDDIVINGVTVSGKLFFIRETGQAQ